VNVAYGKLAVQISLYISPAGAAVDGDLTTASCTGDEASAWWAVDLGQMYQISHVDITSPNLDGYRNYHLTTFSVNFADSETPNVVALNVLGIIIESCVR